MGLHLWLYSSCENINTEYVKPYYISFDIKLRNGKYSSRPGLDYRSDEFPGCGFIWGYKHFAKSRLHTLVFGLWKTIIPGLINGIDTLKNMMIMMMIIIIITPQVDVKYKHTSVYETKTDKNPHNCKITYKYFYY